MLDRAFPIGDCGSDEGISPIEPCGEPTPETLRLAQRLESVSILEIVVERGEGRRSPKICSLIHRGFSRAPPTNPRASFVIIFCNLINFRDKTSSSSAVLSASSLLVHRPNQCHLEKRTVMVVTTLFGAWYVKVEEVAFLGRDELFPSELRRARTPKGKPTLDPERPEPSAIRPAGLSPIGRS